MILSFFYISYFLALLSATDNLVLKIVFGVLAFLCSVVAIFYWNGVERRIAKLEQAEKRITKLEWALKERKKK